MRQTCRACTEQEVNIINLQLRKLQKDHASDEAVSEAQIQLGDALDRQLKLEAPSADAKTQEALYRALADARLGSGNFDDAEVALRKTAALDPKDFVSPRLVDDLEKKGNVAGAREALQASLKVEPKQAMPFIVLGRLDAAVGDLDAAKKDFASALVNEDGKDATETRQLAALASKVGALDKAEALYISLDPDPDVAAQVGFWLDRAGASAALGHASEVKKACDKAHALVESITCPAVSPRP